MQRVGINVIHLGNLTETSGIHYTNPVTNFSGYTQVMGDIEH
ncbi:unnamed protein product [marine sediment metagenome]|uniref:Uncharacterized protein n=1 Tax=marine sediment metagenome TaxID=412755 RepID=X1HIL3_9ZZZZ